MKLNNVILKPFFTYFGGKYRISQYYPKPKYDTIIEPFAGSAGYSIRYPDRKIKLYDLNEKVCGVWDYLIHVSENEILTLPEDVQDVRDWLLPQEAKWLIGFWCCKGVPDPRNKMSTWVKTNPNSMWGKTIKNRICSQLKYIRHWSVKNLSYEKAEFQEATWFIDPPYYGEAGRSYRFNKIDYMKLADFCKTRKGQAIVCESDLATWLPFQEFRVAKIRHGKCKEMIWTNEI